jgi:nitrogen fixation protein NifT
MIRRDKAGQLTLYVPKRDLEDNISAIEFETPEKWGGQITVADGSAYYIEPIPEPRLPITLRAKRAGGED